MDLGLLKTIFLFYGILSIAYSFSLILYLGSTRRSVISLWTCGAFLLGIATILTVNRQDDNLLLTYVGANGIAFVSNILFTLSLCAILGKIYNKYKLISYSIYIWFIYCLTLNTIGTYLGPQYQTIFVSSMMALTHLFAGYYAFQIYQGNSNRHALALSGGFILGAIAWLTRIIFIAFDLGFSAFDTNIFNSILFILIFIFGMMRYFFFYGVLYSQENKDLLNVHLLLEEKDILLEDLNNEKIKSEKANLAKGRFLANVSHEIRTPLHGLIGLVSMTLNSSMSEDVRSSLNKALYSSKALLVILNDILDFSKIEAQMIEINSEPFMVKHLIDDVKDLFSVPAEEKGIELRFDIDPETPEVMMGDFYKLRQILFNLVGNSIKFTRLGFVEIKVLLDLLEEKSAIVNITVKDSGIGISQKDLKVIFEPFHQIDNTNSRSFDGVGLGLPIIQNILMKMNSQLEIHSQLGIGTEATFRLRLEIDHRLSSDQINLTSISQNSVENLPYTSLTGRHVLVAEDNLINIEVVRQYLKFLKIEAHFVTDGQQCIEALKNNTFDCVLMDIQMPHLDGLQATYQIRLIETLQDLPIIGLSAGVAYCDKEKGLHSGMNDFLVKPFEVEELAKTLIKNIC